MEDRFPDLLAKLSSAISNLGDAVFPKFTWDSPQDASWISHDGSLKSFTCSDILQLFKASDTVVGTQNLLKEQGIAGEIFVRTWSNLDPSLEFRCFIHAKRLIGIYICILGETVYAYMLSARNLSAK